MHACDADRIFIQPAILPFPNASDRVCGKQFFDTNIRHHSFLLARLSMALDDLPHIID